MTFEVLRNALTYLLLTTLVVACGQSASSLFDEGGASSNFAWKNEAVNASSIVDLYQQKFSDYREQKFSAHTGESALNLTVTSFNFGLLKNLFVKVADYNVRSRQLQTILENHISRHAPDIVLLQEIWYHRDFNNIKSLIDSGKLENSYQIFPKDGKGRKRRGLVTLIKESVMESTDSVRSGFHRFEDDSGHLRSRVEFLGGVERGALWQEIETTQGIPLLVSNTHLSSEAKTAGVALRFAQTEALVKFVNSREQNAFAIVGGDFNFSPEFVSARPADIEMYSANTQPYVSLMREQPAWFDSFRMARTKSPGYTWDRTTNPITYWSGNGVYPEQRLDYIFVAALAGTPFSVNDAQRSLKSYSILTPVKGTYFRSRTLVQPPITSEGKYDLRYTGKRKELLRRPGTKKAAVKASDHYGVTSKIELYR